MQYYLNYHYGKRILPTDTQDTAVTIVNQQGQNQNLEFGGEVELNSINLTNEDYLTTFFASSGYREHEDDSWTFLSEPLQALVSNGKCYVIVENGRPCTTSHVIPKQAITDNVLKINP